MRKSALLLICSLLSACSPDDQSTIANLYHEFTAFFNAYYNATVEYEKGLKAMKGSVSYDRNARLQIFVSLENAAQGKQFFDRVIEKTALVLKAHPNSSIADNALLLMGRAYYYQREFQPAERKFKEVLTNYTDSDVLDAATFWYGRCLAQQEETEKAREVLGSVIASPKTTNAVRSDAHFALAELAIRREDYQEAIKQIEQGLPLAVDIEQKARAAFVLARIYDRLGDFKSAARYYQMVLSLDPDFELQYAAMLSYALDLREQGDYDHAIRAFQRILADDKYLDKFPEVRYELAQCYELQDRLGRALDLYVEIIRRHKRTEFAARSYLRLGHIKRDISRDFSAALAFYDSAKVEFNQGELGKLIDESAKQMEKILRLYETVEALDSVIQLGIGSAATKPERKPMLSLNAPSRTQPRTRRDYRRSVYLELGGIDSFSDSAESRTAPKRQKVSFVRAQDSATYTRYRYDRILRAAEIANFYQLSLLIPDSASRWYQATLKMIDDSLHTFPDSLQKNLQAQKPPLLYALAEIYRLERKSRLQDSIYRLILDRYPKSKYAKRIREHFGLPIPTDLNEDDEALYTLALEQFEHHHAHTALKTLDSLLVFFPQSALRPKALLLRGFIFEKGLALPDSAIEAYSQLVKKYPDSEEARAVKDKLAFVEEARAAKLGTQKLTTPPDSLSNLAKQKSEEDMQTQLRRRNLFQPAADSSKGILQEPSNGK
ncbi:MAG: tetratricopeptide repeat protein [Chloroherpetonaceae bacterium]|nr:tetratricopeptide repeat protein [Chloroherpetonaceae bacterium]MDW8018707.1 tetratricopeptide repeat protein [Chloroherpetonaceae bacterium]MDW8466317.1 tetratricopeptide repeat protein [Chloroherpetonaceae bacterium]